MEHVVNYTYDELNVGDTATMVREVTDKDVQIFAFNSGDLNPIHLDEEYAAQHKFGKRVAHGMWVGSLLSALMATKLPGPGGFYLSQDLKFKNPVFLGDTLTVKVEVAQKKRRNIVEFDCSVTNQDGDLVVKGVANIMIGNEKVEWPKPQVPEVSVL